MLALTRKKGESLVINNNVEITVLEVRGEQVKIGISAPKEVPIYRKEVYAQIQNEMLQPLLQYGILKERFAALLTDALRASLLEQNGYEVQILEFIDMEHTPKNLLIRAVRGNGIPSKTTENTEKSYQKLCDELNAHGTLEKILKM